MTRPRRTLGLILIGVATVLLFLALWRSVEPVVSVAGASEPAAAVAPRASRPEPRAQTQEDAPLAPERPAAPRLANDDADGGWPGRPTPELLARLDELDFSAFLERHADLAARTVEQYCRQAKAAKATPLFPPTTRDRDAAPFLLPLIDWESSPGHHPPIAGLLELPAPLSRRLRELPAGTWPLTLAADARALDFTWMQQALEYDHWDVSNDPRLAANQGAFFEAAIPNFMPFVQWSKLRLAHALETGDVLAAGAEVRHLAALCDSSGLLVGSMVAVSLRSIENRARTVAAERGLDVSAWPEVNEAQRDAYRRATFDALFYLLPGVSPAVMKRATECAPEPCVALAEGLGAHHALPDLASTNTLEALEALTRSSGCTHGIFDQARRAAPATPTRALYLRDGADPLEGYLDAGVP